MFVHVGIVAFFVAILETSGQDLCSTTSDREVVCISIYKCLSFLSLLDQTQSLSTDNKGTLTQSQCGFDGITPKVCCPKDEVKSSTSPFLNANKMEIRVSPTADVANHPNLGLINNENCGSITETKIILGNKTTVLEFPWMVLISYNISGFSSPQFGCGGTLITKRYVLTAAHCVTELGSGVKLSGVRVGEHDFSKEIDCDEENGVPIICADKYRDYLIEHFHFHEQYSKKEHENDVALIRMNQDADFTADNVRPICLPVGASATLRSKKVIVTGWGTTETGSRSQYLLKVRLEIFPAEECARVYRENHGVNITADRQICAGGKDRRDSCTGDSGGPLQYPAIINGVPKYVQYGIVNFGSANCGTTGYPGVYAKVVYYMGWILDNIK